MIKLLLNVNKLYFNRILYSCAFLNFIFLSSSLVSATGKEKVDTLSTEANNINKTSPDDKDITNKDTTLEEDFAAEIIWLGYAGEVTIATRHETSVSKAPSVITVITAEEIKNLGYRTLTEVLRIIPGFEILKGSTIGGTTVGVRGSLGTGRIRVMINGHNVNNPFISSAFTHFDDFPVDSIKRIEIIRGPGSAVYGEDAFTGVINIITKDTTDIDGVSVISGYGSFDTYDENIVFGKTFGNLGISGFLHYTQTEGFNGIVESDSQTEIDKNFEPLGVPPASQAPGSVHDGRQEYDLNLKTTYKDFYFEGLYINKNKGPVVGLQSALNDETDLENNYFFIETGYKKTFEERFTIKPRIYYDQFDFNYFVESLPENTATGVDIIDTNGDGIPDTPMPVIHPDGLVSNAIVIEKIAGTEIPFDFKLFDGNLFTLGFEYRLVNQTNIHFSTNYNPITLEPLDSMQDFSDTYPFLVEATRRIWSVYLQDTWDITDTLNLTLGVRHNNYSDFGDATTPRAGLTWAFNKNGSFKLLYGEAFRPPDFSELYTSNQPAIQGNPDLDPETIRTYETGLSYKFNKYVMSSVNYFYNSINDLIQLSQIDETQSIRTYENFGDITVHGVEMETRVDITRGNYVFMNYTFQNPEDEDGNNLRWVSKHKGNFGVNVHYWEHINTNLSAFFSGRRYREEDDPRDDLPSYTLLNLSIIGKEFYKTMEVQGTVFNLLDKDYSDPTNITLPNDLPRPGRTFFISLSYKF